MDSYEWCHVHSGALCRGTTGPRFIDVRALEPLAPILSERPLSDAHLRRLAREERHPRSAYLVAVSNREHRGETSLPVMRSWQSKWQSNWGYEETLVNPLDERACSGRLQGTARTDWTTQTGLRIRRLGVRIPPSAHSSERSHTPERASVYEPASSSRARRRLMLEPASSASAVR